MNACSIDIADMLEQESGLGLVLGTNLFTSHRPAHPSNVASVYDAPGGWVDPTLQAEKENLYHHDVQVQVRNTEYNEAMSLGQSIMDALHGLNNFEFGTTYYAFIRCTTPPFLLEVDSQNRSIIVINFQIQRR